MENWRHVSTSSMSSIVPQGGKPCAASRMKAPEASTVIREGRGWSSRQKASARLSLSLMVATAPSSIRVDSTARGNGWLPLQDFAQRPRYAAERQVILLADAQLGGSRGEDGDGVIVR